MLAVKQKQLATSQDDDDGGGTLSNVEGLQATGQQNQGGMLSAADRDTIGGGGDGDGGGNTGSQDPADDTLNYGSIVAVPKTPKKRNVPVLVAVVLLLLAGGGAGWWCYHNRHTSRIPTTQDMQQPYSQSADATSAVEMTGANAVIYSVPVDGTTAVEVSGSRAAIVPLDATSSVEMSGSNVIYSIPMDATTAVEMTGLNSVPLEGTAGVAFVSNPTYHAIVTATTCATSV